MTLMDMRRRAMMGAQVGDIPNYLCFTAEQAGSTISLIRSETQATPTKISLEASYDGCTWFTWFDDSYDAETLTLTTVGSKIYLRGDNEKISSSSSNYRFFEMTGEISASGNIMSLLSKKMDTTDVVARFPSLFLNCTSLKSAPELPAMVLAARAYMDMFNGCTALLSAPELPAINISDRAYLNMFRGCTSLRIPPRLPGTSLAVNCYNAMFYSCSGIKLSAEKTGEYTVEYRIPTSGVASAESNSLVNMFYGTGGTFRGTPTINTTYWLAE